MSEINLEFLKTRPVWGKFVEQHGGELEAQLRLEELMRMDVAGPMPDELTTVKVSSEVSDERMAELREMVEDDAPAELVLGRVHSEDKDAAREETNE